MKYKLFFLLLPFIMSSQINKITVKYHVVINDDEKFSKDDMLKEYYKSSIDAAKFLEFTLSVNDSETYFFDNDLLENSSNSSVSFAKAFCGYTSTVYSKKNENVYYQTFDDSMFGYYVIKKDKNKDWEFVNETKKIEGFLCYKAILKEFIVNPISKKSSTYIVTAWYTPNLPISAGPLNYFGLPGLILQCEKRGIVYGAVKIELNLEKEPIIIKPDLNKIKDAYEIEQLKLNYFNSK
ncbi:GLPGLI family protein [Flavobacterium sp. j3]|uniref:GLPGLI family protein n=1 Tax=Flavobacterium aureirubrum TaxID=3133147 RepID=A0ABU9N601_9FLAO